MKFDKNLQILRRKYDYSQEQLAEKLQVSRQAVSKWESGSSYPEMDKLLQMCELFNCSVDTLVKGKIEESNEDNFMKKFALAISTGVGMIILGIAILIGLYSFLSEESLIPVIIFLTLIFLAVFIFIFFGLKKEEYDKLDKVIVRTKEEKNKNIFCLSIGIALVLFDIIILLILCSIFGDESPIIIPIFMTIMAVAVSIIVYNGIMMDTHEEKKENITSRISSVIMLLATAIFLTIGFCYNVWHPTWAVFPIGGILCGIVGTITGENK